MDAREQLRQALDAERARLRAVVPANTQAVLLALIRARDRFALAVDRAADPVIAPDPAGAPQAPDRADERCLYGLGWNGALRLCFATPSEHTHAARPQPGADLDGWAEGFLRDCGRLGAADLILADLETGYLQVQARDERLFDAWIATSRLPAERRERADFDWWANALRARTAAELRALTAERPQVRRQHRTFTAERGLPADAYTTTPPIDDHYRRCGALAVRRMGHQHSYPPDAAIGGITFQFYLDLLATLIGWLARDLDLRASGGAADGVPESEAALAVPRSEGALVAALAGALDADAAVVRQALGAFTLDGENAGYHSAPPGAAAPPCVRVGEDRIAWSVAGLLAEPIVFLMRELRRRHDREYHNSAHLREGVFRQDLYGLFPGPRFVKSAGRVELRREGGGLRTDLDALIFDRKTGALGIFELKSQDPFARSAGERQRQRDYFLGATHQIAATRLWLQRHDPTELLARFDSATAKRFRVQRVYLFVLGRYLAHFAEGSAPDRHAAWGAWPQVLRLVDDRPFTPSDANPIRALFDRLTKDTPPRNPDAAPGVPEITLGTGRIRVYPSFAALKADGG